VGLDIYIQIETAQNSKEKAGTRPTFSSLRLLAAYWHDQFTNSAPLLS
jgi:hypothetical protein